MASYSDKLISKGLIKTPRWFSNSVQYETIMGSVVYGVSNDTSDMDIYGFCIPPKRVVFPHTDGWIPKFNKPGESFDQLNPKGIEDKERRKIYDLDIYNIVKYFKLCAECNPNMIDSLFTPLRCVLHCTPIGEIVRSNRKLFLSKKAWHTFKGYAYSQLSKLRKSNIKYITINKKISNVCKMRTKNPQPGSKRALDIKEHGFDCKFAYHLVRLLDEVQQILETGDLVLGRNAEEMKAIRRGEWTVEQVYAKVDTMTPILEDLYGKSTLRHSPDWDGLTKVLLNCLEEYYGTLENCIIEEDVEAAALREIIQLADRALKRSK